MAEEERVCRDVTGHSEINAKEIEFAIHHDMDEDGIYRESNSAQIINNLSNSEIKAEEKQKTSQKSDGLVARKQQLVLAALKYKSLTAWVVEEKLKLGICW